MTECASDGKERPNTPGWSHRCLKLVKNPKCDFLNRLFRALLALESVSMSFVTCCPIHGGP